MDWAGERGGGTVGRRRALVGAVRYYCEVVYAVERTCVGRGRPTHTGVGCLANVRMRLVCVCAALRLASG